MSERPTRRGSAVASIAPGSWAVVAAVWLIATAVRGVAAPQAPTEPMRSTLAGVYTAAQADRGKAGFQNLCVSCHNVASQSGAPWALRWAGRPVSDLYGLIKESMPVEEPQSIPPAVKVLIVAYLLKLNGMPAGSDELPGDLEALKRIRIDFPSHMER